MTRKTVVGLIAIVAITAAVMFAGCFEKEEPAPSQQLSELLSAEFDFGELETFDFDNDGFDDKYVYTFETEEVAEDLFLDRSLEIEKTDSGFDGKIVLKFENKGDTPIEYTHIEEIPKSFAESVDDLVFSVPPDEIIDPDPEVSWEVKVLKRTIEKIKIEAALELVPTALFGTKEEKEEAFTGFVLDHLDDIVFINELNKCGQLKYKEGVVWPDYKEGEAWNTCIGALILRFPDMFEESDCEQIDKDSLFSPSLRSRGDEAILQFRGDVLYAACKAITTDDWRACPDNIKSPSFKAVDACKTLAFFAAFTGKCQYIKDSQEEDECIYDAAVRADCSDGCKLIADEISRNTCLAEITQDEKYCKAIKDEEARKYCCDKIKDEELRKECLGEEEEEKKIDASIICENRGTQDKIDYCYSFYAKELNNPELCEKIKNQVLKDHCRFDFGTICDKSENPDFRGADCKLCLCASKKFSEKELITGRYGYFTTCIGKMKTYRECTEQDYTDEEMKKDDNKAYWEGTPCRDAKRFYENVKKRCSS